MIWAYLYKLPFFGAGTTDPCGDHSFFGLPHWDKYLPHAPDPDKLQNCVIGPIKLPDDLGKIILGVIDMLLFVAGIVAIVSIIIAGVSYITAGGSVEKTASARKRIWNSLIGLAIVSIAASLVRFIGLKLGG